LDKNSFDAVVIYNPQYSINTAMAESAQEHGVRTYYMSATGSLAEMRTTVRMYEWFKYLLKDPALSMWDKNEFEASKTDLKRISKHMKQAKRATSAFTYSSKPTGQSARTKFGIMEGKIFLLAMSSYDEYSAAGIATLFPEGMTKSSVFKDQTEWLKFTIAWFSRIPDVSLVVRPHPREIPNKRESRSAPKNVELLEVLRDLPKNVFLDDPYDSFSLYDHFLEIDGVIVSWSNVGLESLMHGIPVVGYDKNLCAYPDNLYFTGDSVPAYVSNLELLLATPKSPQIATSANNWFAFSNFKKAIKLGGPIEERVPFKFIPFRQSIFYRLRRKFTKAFLWLDLNYPFFVKPTSSLESLLKGERDSIS
jgi:hypothetical protein